MTPAYDALVAARKACRICIERYPGRIRNCAEFDYDPNVISHWEQWLGHKNPKLLIVGQDFAEAHRAGRGRNGGFEGQAEDEVVATDGRLMR